MECTTENKLALNRKKAFIIQSVTVMIGILGASAIEKIGFPLIGWFLGGAIIGIGILFAYKKADVRWKGLNLIVPVLTGLTSMTIYYAFNL